MAGDEWAGWRGPSWRPAGSSSVSPAIAPAIIPGTLVLIRFDRHSPCGHHLLHELPLFQAVGVVDWIDDRFRDHKVAVRFPSVKTEPFGASWVDAFAPGELVVIQP
jgi:hypothetical protein